MLPCGGATNLGGGASSRSSLAASGARGRPREPAAEIRARSVGVLAGEIETRKRNDNEEDELVGATHVVALV